MKITIDKKSGFCFGVIKAIEIAEKVLEEENNLFCLGELVHNEQEMLRLKAKGLDVIGNDEINRKQHKKIMIRAHGEPPKTYKKAKKNGTRIIDATCPIVLKLQQQIRTDWKEIKAEDGQIIIFGKPYHPEVIGLMGQVPNAILISSENDLYKINYNKPVRLFSQTTQTTEQYLHIQSLIKKAMRKGNNEKFRAYNTICGQVSNRITHLAQFAKKFEIIVFVSGKKSSNGKYLFSVCKKNNPKTYFVTNAKEINAKWFVEVENVGVCGATSTPKWLMEKVAEHIKTCI